MVTPASCNICDAALDLRFQDLEDILTSEKFSIAACHACGLGHTLPRPENLEPYYGERYYGNRHGFTASFCAARRVRIVAQAFPHQARDLRLLDIGCGAGTFMLAAREKGWKVFGSEINPLPATAHGLEVRSSLQEMAELAPFDCITLWHSLEHLPDPRSTLNQIGDLLAPGGVVIVAVPDAQGLQARIFGPHWFPLDVPRHLYHFGEKSLRRLLENSGFSVTHASHQEIEYDLFSCNISLLNIFLKRPIDGFEFLVGRPRRVSLLRMASVVLLSALLLPITLAITMLGSLQRQGGTLILTARRAQDS